MPKTQIYASQITGLVASVPIGMPVPFLYDGAGTIVQTNPNQFIKLSKDLHTTGLYNDGKLTGQTPTVIDETRFYYAVINDVESPMFGSQITLINSTKNTTTTDKAVETFLGAGETAGVRLADQMQGFRLLETGNPPSNQYTVTTNSGYVSLQFDTRYIFPLSDTVHGTPRVGYTTRPVTVSAVYYMRIK